MTKNIASFEAEMRAFKAAIDKTELKELYKMMFPNYPDIVTVAQLQEMLGVSRHLAYDLNSDGYISGVKIGNAYKIPKVNVINYVMEEGVKNAS